MMLPDTNVLSEFMRPAPSQEVGAWLDSQDSTRVWVGAVTRADIELGGLAARWAPRTQTACSTPRPTFF